MDIMGSPMPVVIAGGSVDVSGGIPYANITVAGEVAVYTKAIAVGYAKFFSLSYMANSALGGINLKIEIQQSFRLPTTEGATDTYWAEPVNMADIVASLTVENTIYHQSLAPIPLPFMRFKITGLTGNTSDTILKMWLTKQEAA